jgi:hypothetical protein
MLHSSYSALSRGLGEKRLVLRHNFRALTVWTLNRLFPVLADGHRESETLVTLFAKKFVNRHMGRSGLVNQNIEWNGEVRIARFQSGQLSLRCRITRPYRLCSQSRLDEVARDDRPPTGGLMRCRLWS